MSTYMRHIKEISTSVASYSSFLKMPLIEPRNPAILFTHLSCCQQALAVQEMSYICLLSDVVNTSWFEIKPS